MYVMGNCLTNLIRCCVAPKSGLLRKQKGVGHYKEAQSTISKQQLDITLKGKANDVSDQWKFPVRFVPLIRTHESIFIDFPDEA